MSADGKSFTNKIGGNFGELMEMQLETRSCSSCGSTYKVLHSSKQQVCSEFCRRKESYNPKWKSWHHDQAYIARKAERTR